MDDIAVGANGDDDGGSRRGAVWVVFLWSNGTVKGQQKISATEGGFTGRLDDDDDFGVSVAGLSDVDADNVVDLAVGANGDDDGGSRNGAVWVLFLRTDGTVKGHQKISETQGDFGGRLANHDFFGQSVTALSDLDSDGVMDMAVGVREDDDGGSGRGAVYVLFLRSDGTVKRRQKVSDTAGGFTGRLENNDFFGYSVARLHDLDGDGVVELAAGAKWDDDGGQRRGAVWVLYLRTDGTVKDHLLISRKPGITFGPFFALNDYFGTAVASVPNLDGSATVGLAVGAMVDDGGTNRGGVWMIFVPSQLRNTQPQESLDGMYQIDPSAPPVSWQFGTETHEVGGQAFSSASSGISSGGRGLFLS